VSPPAAPSLADDLAGAALSLARRFGAGATMWCASPQWPAHGRHVAVEFVHPVIVGKRALPAVHLDTDDLVGTARLLARPGDVILGIGAADDGRLQAVLRRSDAWGLTSLWLGAGPRPTAGAADHVIWIDGSQAVHAARSGEIVMLYHLLWELTHVVFEHPGLLDAGPMCTDEVCVAEVAAVLDDRSADVVAAGVHETVDVSLVERVDPGDLVLVHAGVAISVLQEPAQ
jgi:hydrogenase maturation factor